MKRILLAGAAVAALSSVSYAADLGAPGPETDWSGFYIGANVGFGWADLDQDVAPGGFEATDSVDGVFGGGQIGYNFQLANRIVLGIEADIQASDFEADQPPAYTDFAPVFPRTDWFGTVRGRIGYAFGDFLPYVTGGLAFGDISVDLPINPTDAIEGSDTGVGWTVGAGMEYAVSERVSVKAEYLYLDLGDETFDDNALNGVSAEVGVTAHTLKIGLNYHF